MVRRKKISFLARVRVKRKVSFRARGEEVAFTARVPSKKRSRVTFFKRRRKKQRG
jgi:hypothetical protein